MDKKISVFLIVVCCLACDATTIFNNAIDSSFSSSLNSPFGASNSPLFGASNSPFGASNPSFGASPWTNRIGLRQQQQNPTFGSFGPFSSPLKRRCPLCDSSVYDYCSEKLFHDSCCCNNPNNPYDQLPYQCQYADCGFLHANSCREHKLITACCCTNYLLYKK
ncbi:unnamed protein product [Ceutorhynchus assimilis]|uniref:CCC domain-containing protein n=1 Tax=Ceutorhynchus assimilis TaxID=467358 RepID=A0A9P0DL87_9CUCU|nr:unnamed protein product [Ceutorhynchus assimilis]